VSREEIVARAGALAPWWLGSGALVAALVTAANWFERDHLGPLYPTARWAILLGIAVGLGLAYLRTPDLGVSPGASFSRSREPGAPPESYQRALATFGRSWLWAGGLFPLLCLVAAEAAPAANAMVLLDNAPLDGASAALCVFLGGLAAVATFATSWGTKLVLIARGS
jgi:hypothetical protein